ncbi:uncharacterized protein LOC105844789 [Hydra vulgaris]|uniref:uncharacterized protein LOC105844789 n=1 Tax=Hydra vulgaris TaxID=6087 RepID=UPI0032EA1299
MRSPTEQIESEMEEIDAEIHEIANDYMDEFETEVDAEKESHHDTVNVMTSQVYEKNLKILSDSSFWNVPILDNFRVEIIKKGSSSFQNKDRLFSIVTKQGARTKGGVRQLSKDWFYKTMPDSEKILRSWMVYSLVSEKLYFFCCRLFAVNATETTSKFVTGFQKWWKLSPKLHNLEISDNHLCCFEKWKTLASGLELNKTIDAKGIVLMDKEKKKYRDILHRLLDITLFLAK